MGTEDQTFNALKRTPFNTVLNMCYEADPYSSYVFHRLHGDGKWRVASHLHDIVTRNGWDIDEFNEQYEIANK